MERFDVEREEAAESTVWASGCKTWYLDDNDRPAAWPGTCDRLWEEIGKPRLSDSR